MWPFKEKPDTRKASESAVAIADSLHHDPARWSLQGDNYLRHDSGIIIGAAGFTWVPNLDDEPDSNGELIAKAVDDWVAEQMKLPPPVLEAKNAEGGQL